MTDPSERAAFAAYVRDDYQCDDDVHWEEGPGYPDAPFISQDGKYHSLADEVYPAYQRGRSDGQARAALPGPSVEEVARAMCVADHGRDLDRISGTLRRLRMKQARAVLALFPAAPQAERDCGCGPEAHRFPGNCPQEDPDADA